MVQVLSHGTKSKNMVDAAIDISASFLNIRWEFGKKFRWFNFQELVSVSRSKTPTSPKLSPKSQEVWIGRRISFKVIFFSEVGWFTLLGYAILILFANYLHEMKHGASSDVPYVSKLGILLTI